MNGVPAKPEFYTQKKKNDKLWQTLFCHCKSHDLTIVVSSLLNRAFAVVASALGIPSLLPFLKAVCRSKKSWQARHTGIKIVQQIAILMGCAILPHLRNLVEIIEHGKTGVA